MTIAACPHSLAERETAVADGMCPICSANALSRRSTLPLPEAQAKELSDWILWFLENECSLDPSCVSKADRSNIENAIVNTIIPAELPAPPLPQEIAGLIEQIKNSIDTRLNDVLCEMKPDYDDSITGFNEAWDVVRKYFRERTPALIASRLSTPSLPRERDPLSADELNDCYQTSGYKAPTPPLPQEIAGLIKRANDGSINTDRAEDRKLFAELGDALRAQAQENERLKTIHFASDVMHLEKTELMLNQKERIRELEAERDEAKTDYLRRHKDVGDQMDRRIKAEAERDAIRDELHKVASFIEPHWQGAGAKLEAEWIIRVIGEMNSEADAIRAKTIKECAEAKVTLPRVKFALAPDAYLQGFGDGATAMSVSIRALAQTDEAKT